MALGCARLERFLTSHVSALSLSCKRHASSSAVLTQNPTDVEIQNAGSPSPGPSAHPPRRPKVEEYLQYVAQNSVVTLEDLESFRPKSHASVGSAKYETEYQALLEKLDRSFTVSQLRQFLHLYGIPVSSKVRKHTAATSIIEKQWGWPSLAKSQKLARSKKERSSRVFSLNPQQAFLLLGKDGTEILSLSQTYNVRLQFSRKPLSLTISGMTDSAEQLERHVENLKNEISWQDFDPPRQIDLSSSSQSLSRSSGCFLEGLPDGKIRIWYRESSNDSASRAKRLIIQHAIQDVKVPLAGSPLKVPSNLSARTEPPAYAFYPFFSESTRAPGNRGYFRLRRVGKWFSEGDKVVSQNDNGATHDYIATTGNYITAREQLLAQMKTKYRDRTFSVTATPGHIVLNSQGSSGLSLTPPIEGQKNFGEVMAWIQDQSPSTDFIHGAPMRFWQAPDSDQPWRRRLVYETIPSPTEQTQILVCEYTSQKSAGSHVEAEADPVEVSCLPGPVLRGGLVSRLDILMPDDSRDLRLTLTSDVTLPETSWPTELSDLIRNGASSLTSEAPLIFEHEKKHFILKEDSFIQSNSFPVKSEDVPVNVISERRFEPQSSDSYLSYEVRCSDLSSDAAWTTFWNKCEKVAHDGSAAQLDQAPFQP